MKQPILIGQTDYTSLVKIRNDDGTPATGLTEASIDLAYVRVETDNDVVSADVTPAALANLTAAHSDWGFEEVSATDHPGVYRLDYADVVFEAGAWSAVVTITGTGLDPTSVEFVLVTFDPKATTLPTGSVTAGAIANAAIDAATFAADVDAEFLSYLVDDATRIDASALNTAAVTTVPAIVVDTNELQTDWANGGRLDLILDARSSQTSVDDIPTNAELATALAAADDAVLAAIAALNNLSAAQVNAEVVDALATDTYAEPGQGTPAATASLATKIGYSYKAWRNRHTQTASEYALYADDATTKDQEAAVSDNGTTFDRGEVATGA